MAGIGALLLFLTALHGMEDYKPHFISRRPQLKPVEANEIPMIDNMMTIADIMKTFPIDSEITCPEGDLKFAYPSTCSKYVICKDDEAHVRSCPPGMHFDKKHLYCRLAFEVSCDAVITERRRCPIGEEYSDCGTSCERTCDNYQEQIICPAMCVKGCFCKSGLVRDRTGKCLRVSDCRRRSILSLWEDDEDE